MKFYDKGFITRYQNYTKVEILSAGTTILNLDIYKDRVCKSTFECQSLSSFNEEFLDKNYKKSFLKDLFDKEDKKIVFRDKEKRILIKIIKD